MIEDRTRCEETVAAVDDYVAGTLDPERVAAFEAHVAVCEACHVALEEAQETLTSDGELHEMEAARTRTFSGLGPMTKIVAIACLVLVLYMSASLYARLFLTHEHPYRPSSVDNLKQMGVVFKMYASESRGELYPTLSSQGDVWVPDLRYIFPWYITAPQILVNPGHFDEASKYEEMIVALSENQEDYQAAERVMSKSYVYFGYVVRGVREFEQFVQGVAAYAPAQRVDGIPTEDGGLLPSLREGVENFYVTDVSDGMAVARMAAEIPVMFEVPYPEGDPRHQDDCYVLYLDGHVAAVPYGERFPALPEVAAMMRDAGALE